MKDSNKRIKLVRIIFFGAAIAIMAIGVFFSFLIALLNDAPGFVLLGSAAALGVAALLCGLGEVIVLLTKNNILLSGISDKLNK